MDVPMLEASSELTPVQAQSLALVRGQIFKDMPQDLYIPPDALEVFLEAFEGPLDLLLYLIRQHNLDILDIPIAEITRQYMVYVELMKEFRLELAAEYLVMSATLAEIKSRMLLPHSPVDEEDEGDPRAELVRRLQEYERFKVAAENLELLPRIGRDTFVAYAEPMGLATAKPLPEVPLDELLSALRDIIKRSALTVSHAITREPLSVRERMTHVLDKLNAQPERLINFALLFGLQEGRMGLVVTFIAVLELLRQSVIEIIQNEPFSTLYVKAVSET